MEIAEARDLAQGSRRLTERSIIFWTVGRSGALLGFDRDGNVRYRFAGDGRAAFTPRGGYLRFLAALLPGAVGTRSSRRRA